MNDAPRAHSWKLWFASVFLLYVFTFIIEVCAIYSQAVFQFKVDWVLWLLVVEIGLVLLLVWRVPPGGTFDLFVAGLSVVAMCCLWWMAWQQQNDYWTRWLIVFGGRCLIAFGWMCVPLGLLGVAGSICIYLWSERSRRPFHWMKYWMVVCLFLTTCELTGQLAIQDPTQQLLNLPQTLPQAESERFHTESDHVHIVAIGGSTTLGFPYQPKVSFANVAALCIEASQTVTCKVSNLAVTGDNFRNSVERFETLTNKPDVVVIYTGHNEFFYDVKSYSLEEALSRSGLDPWMSWSKTYSLYASMVDQINTGPRTEKLEWLQGKQFTDLVRKARFHAFQNQLRQFSEYAQQHDIPVIWMVPASGESTFQPNRTEPQRDLTLAQKRELLQQVEHAKQFMNREEWHPAIEQLEEISASFGELAEVEFLLGKCHEQVQQWSKAQRHYDRAIDLDGSPARANRRYRQVVRDIAKEFQMPCIDSPEILRRLTPHQILDRSVIHDNVHPCLRGHYHLGLAVADEIQNLFAIQALDSKDPPTYKDVLNKLQFQTEDLALAYRRTAHCLDRLCRYRIETQQRLSEAHQYNTWADALSAGELSPGEDGTESLIDPSHGVTFRTLR